MINSQFRLTSRDLYTVIWGTLIGLTSLGAVVLLNEKSWLVAVTWGHLAVLAMIYKEYGALGSRPLETRQMLVAFTIVSGIGAFFFPNLDEQKMQQDTARATEALPQRVAKPAISATPHPSGDTKPLAIKSAPEPAPTSAPKPLVATPEPKTKPEAAPRPTSVPRQTSRKVVSTTVDDVLDIYEANQIAGERRFSGAKILISGKTERVREAFGTGILILKSVKSGRTLELYFTENGESDLGEVMPGQRVIAECYQAIEMMGAVTISDCRSVK
jgi:hypothetical protein